MIAKKYAILSVSNDGFLNDLGFGYNRELIKHGATFINYEELYLELGNKNVQKYLLDVINEKGIEVLIFQSRPTDFHFSIEFFKLISNKVYIAMILGDVDHYFGERDVYYAQCMDLMLITDCLSKYRFRQYGVNAISFYSSYDKNKYFKADIIKRNIGVSFVGDVTNKVNRRTNIEYLVSNGISIEVFGTGTKNGQVTLEKMVDIFNRTKININFAGISLQNPFKKEPKINNRLRQMKGRMAEIALCGGFILSEYVPGIEDVFELNKEIAVFHTKEDMLEKTKYYLKNRDERETIAMNGYHRALRDYEISRAIPNLIGRIEEIRKKNFNKLAEIYIDKYFLKNYTTFRFFLIIKFFKLRKWKFVYEEIKIVLNNKNINYYQAFIFFLDLTPTLKKKLLEAKRCISNLFISKKDSKLTVI
ncbi:MAG: hypothetical protein A3H98_14140 [Bacteroidetes bacterium RIFCSPLOWO2_02_FULL_36_8]|nr:MAG: hypothetical protein A3H98_14140 [Bacteroidetes bacterium RIFCSPLOWO2_02_FULL_36_8]